MLGWKRINNIPRRIYGKEDFDDWDKEIRIDANGVMMMVDYDDVDHKEAELIAEFIAEKSSEYEDWKSAKKKK